MQGNETRIDGTAEILEGIKTIRMIGIAEYMQKTISALRLREICLTKKYRQVLVVALALCESFYIDPMFSATQHNLILDDFTDAQSCSILYVDPLPCHNFCDRHAYRTGNGYHHTIRFSVVDIAHSHTTDLSIPGSPSADICMCMSCADSNLP